MTHFLGGYAEVVKEDEKPVTKTVEEHERVVIRETEETTVTEPADETDGEPDTEGTEG